MWDSLPEGNGHEATRRCPAQPGRRGSVARPARSQRADRERSARVGESADLVLLVAVCAAGSEAESQTHQGAGVWREIQEAQASLVGRDAERREWRRERTVDESHTRSANSCACCTACQESPTARAWTAGG